MSRPDRPWNEDATSNAPKTGQKRRMDDEDDEEGTPSKKVKSTAPSSVADDASDVGAEDRSDSPAVVVPGDKEAVEVKEVTNKVGDVELDGTDTPLAVEETVEAAVEVSGKEPEEEPGQVQVDKESQQEVDKAAAVPLPADDDVTKEDETVAPIAQEETNQETPILLDAPATPDTPVAAVPPPVEETSDVPLTKTVTPQKPTKKPASKRKSPSKAKATS